MEMNSRQKMKKSLRSKIILAVLIFCTFIDLACVAFNYRKYVSLNRDYTVELARTVISTCILSIDGDRVSDYLDTRKRDSNYYEVWNKLIDYRNTNQDIMKLSVVTFDEEGCHYIFDTDLSENGAFLGDSCDYDPVQESVKGRLANYSMNDSLVYPTHTDLYIPVKSSYNIPVAYVVAGISTEKVRNKQLAYLLRLVLMITAIVLVGGAMLLVFMNRCIIKPINTMSEAAVSYIRNFEDTNASPLQQLHIETGDELEHLCESMKKMENDILVSSASLINATWNSNHDSMTQLYNKRYYKDLLEKLTLAESGVGVVYLDIDNLKLVNDRYGHDTGDQVILKAAEVIHRYEETGCECCRVGGDEFVMLLRDGSPEQVERLVEWLRADEQNTLLEPNGEFICRLAAGGSYQQPGRTVRDTIKAAEEEMYKNKHSRR